MRPAAEDRQRLPAGATQHVSTALKSVTSTHQRDVQRSERRDLPCDGPTASQAALEMRVPVGDRMPAERTCTKARCTLTSAHTARLARRGPA